MALDCSYNSLQQGANQCKKTIGGIRKTYAIDWQDVNTVTIAAGVITAVTLKASATFAVYEGDDDNTSSYNQEGVRSGLDYRVNQTATLKFTGASSDKVVTANKAKGIIKGLFFHLFNDGGIQSQGVEIANEAGVTGAPTTVGAKINPNVNSNTGEASSDVTFNIVSTGSDLLPCAMTEAALDAMSDIS